MTEKYRFIDGTLFEYSEDEFGRGRYIAVYTDYRANTKERAVKAYEESFFTEECCDQFR